MPFRAASACLGAALSSITRLTVAIWCLLQVRQRPRIFVVLCRGGGARQGRDGSGSTKRPGLHAI
eukprot:12164778-Alexandrium_andersonii.AAC.1